MGCACALAKQLLETCLYLFVAHAAIHSLPMQSSPQNPLGTTSTDRTSVECRTHIRGKGASRTRLATVTEWLQCWQAVVSCHLPVIFKPRPGSISWGLHLPSQGISRVGQQRQGALELCSAFSCGCRRSRVPQTSNPSLLTARFCGRSMRGTR